MNPTLRIPTSQQLRFVNRGDYPNTPNTYENRLHNDFVFRNRMEKPACQIVHKTLDTVWVQFRTTYSRLECSVYRYGTNVMLYSLLHKYITEYVNTDGDTVFVYEIEIPINTISGKAFVEIRGVQWDLPEVWFWSEPFEVITDSSNTQLIQWGGAYSISDGMTWSTADAYTIDRYQQMRIKSRIIDLKFGTSKTTYTDGNNDLTTLSAYPSATHVWNIEEIPYYMVEIISLALQHDVFILDGVYYNIAEGFELKNFPNNLLSSGSVPLVRLNYQNYLTDPVLTGELPTLPNVERWTRVDVRTTKIDTRKTNR